MIEKIMDAMHLPESARQIQRIQTEHRLKLIDFWGIGPGARVLEIGCGQGDTLAALAYVVGPSGFVHGVDIANEDYGAPETLGQARERLMLGELGDRIQMDFEFDIMQGEPFVENEYDYIVLSHCLWYLSDKRVLMDILKRVQPWGRKLCIAEWNPCIDSSDQLGHFMAVIVQAFCESYKEESESNVRTLFYPEEIEQAVAESDWLITKTDTVYSEQMQDGRWEIWNTVDFYPGEIEKMDTMPDKMKSLLKAQIEELKDTENTKPMAAFCLLAEK